MHKVPVPTDTFRYSRYDLMHKAKFLQNTRKNTPVFERFSNWFMGVCRFSTRPSGL